MHWRRAAPSWLAIRRLDNPTLARWFNTCTQALNGARQNCARGGASRWPGRSSRRSRCAPCRPASTTSARSGPGLVDFSLFKTFTLPATMRLQVRVESFNLFNTPWFGNAERDGDERGVRPGDADPGQRPAQHPAGRAAAVLSSKDRQSVFPCDKDGARQSPPFRHVRAAEQSRACWRMRNARVVIQGRQSLLAFPFSELGGFVQCTSRCTTGCERNRSK